MADKRKTALMDEDGRLYPVKTDNSLNAEGITGEELRPKIFGRILIS